MASRFLFNEPLWQELASRIPKAKVVRAAVAYLGAGASGMLPLRKGDKLVVDMSLRAVRSGTTDPREVRKFLRRGVEVFSRGSLHAKFFVIDRIVIAGSSNISKHARDGLDEAAILTDDAATVRRAATTFDALCTEPVRKDYLMKCIKVSAPKFAGGVGTGPRKKLTQGKVWIVGGLQYREVPEGERARAEGIVEKAAKKLQDFQKSEVDYLHYPNRRKFFDALREGDWIIQCIGDKTGFDVGPPSRFMGVERDARGGGKFRYYVLLEAPSGQEMIRWSQLRRAAPPSVLQVKGAKPRTLPIVDGDDADRILRLWDARGRFRGRAK